MQFNPQPSLTYNDIGLVPRILSTQKSRRHVNTCMKINGQKISLPIILAPMKKIVGFDMAIEVSNLKGMFSFPRSKLFEEDLKEYKFLEQKEKDYLIASVPATGNFLERIRTLHDYHNVNRFCIDVANGFSTVVEDAIKEIRKLSFGKNLWLMTGNVASWEGYKFLRNLGVDAVRVGIGGGSVCTTSIATGVGVGQASLVRDIAIRRQISNTSDWPLIVADGGIKNPGDIGKSIALGADVIMSGTLFAGTDESPGRVIHHNGMSYKHLAGQASMHIKDSNSFVEGGDLLVPYKGQVQTIWHSLEQGLRSTMAYMGANNLEELRNLPDDCFTRLSNSAIVERKVHA